MKKVIVASLNPAKIKAVTAAFETVFPHDSFEFIGVDVPSGVAEQPMSDAETHQGAKNRVRQAKNQQPDGDYYVGLEAGIEHNMAFAWMVVASSKRYGESRSASLMLPPIVSEKLNSNNELGDVMDDVFHTQNIKQKGGAISLLTQGVLTRSSVYYQALILALIPFVHPSIFPEHQ